MGEWWNAFAARAERRGEDLGRVDGAGEPAGTEADGGGQARVPGRAGDESPERDGAAPARSEDPPGESEAPRQEPMRVEVSERAGACFGVQRALDMLDETIDGATGTVRTLGPLIHNPRVVAELESRGVEVVDAVPDDAGSTLVLRTHGVTPEVEREAACAGLRVVDATCPYVHTVQSKAERLARDGRQVIVFGEQGHPEVEGILARAEGAVAVGSADEALELVRGGLADGRPLGLVAQTTQSEERFESLAGALREATDGGVEVHRTICHATRERQEAARELARRADLMIVIGGRNSANTTRLAELCAECCETHHVEGPGELDRRWFDRCALVGVTAGASTPKSQIDEVVAAIEGGDGIVG